MCGIFGLVVRKGSDIKFESINLALERLGVLSELRGKDSSGFLSRNEKANSISILKTNEWDEHWENKIDYNLFNDLV